MDKKGNIKYCVIGFLVESLVILVIFFFFRKVIKVFIVIINIKIIGMMFVI